ncbi:MAG: hypothetical protein P1U29_03265 [Candidatus Pelagibacter bacterium]|nr:hypothetical protein [Vicingaceae bacterium]MDF1857968.1 hypothetical protein [Candidatus Pelagibacter bacterium]
MSNVRRYLANAQKMANESFSNADGFIDDDLSFSGEDFFSANGQNIGGGSAPTSQPYIVNVTSTSGSAVANFEVLGSYEFLNNAGFTAGGDLVVGSITISSGISGITYREMLYQFMNNPYSVGLTYVQSATANQILETISVNTRDANGNEAQKTLVPTIDPYQQQSTVLAMKYAYRIDGFTKLIIRQVLANATVKLYFYPSDNINLARGLAGQNVSRQYGNPGIVKAQTIKLS